jgi:hypothetical protein
MGSKLALQGTHLARNCYRRLIIIQILTLWRRRTSHSRPVGAASFVTLLHSKWRSFSAAAAQPKHQPAWPCDARSMVILPRYCKEMSRYAAVPDCWVRYLARKVLLCYGAAVSSLGVEQGIADSCLRGGCVCAEEEGRLCFPLAHLLIALKLAVRLQSSVSALTLP